LLSEIVKFSPARKISLASFIHSPRSCGAPCPFIKLSVSEKQILAHRFNILYMNSCIFCKIANKEIPVELLYEDDLVVAFKDIKPIVPVHVLIIPKEHIESIADLTGKHELLAGRMIMVAKKLAEKLGIAKSGYKLLFRVRRNGGQEVPHIHLHLLGGGRMSENIRVV